MIGIKFPPAGSSKLIAEVFPHEIHFLYGLVDGEYRTELGRNDWFVIDGNAETTILVNYREVVIYSKTSDTIFHIQRKFSSDNPQRFYYNGLEIKMGALSLNKSWELIVQRYPYFIINPQMKFDRISLTGGIRCGFLP